MEIKKKGCSCSLFSFYESKFQLLAFVATFFTAYLIYSIGFSGAFLFDDFINLEALGYQGQVDSWYKLVEYLQSGIAGPTGRPVSLASFLLDDNSWPSQPESFKATNVLFHLIVGLLLFWLFLRLGRSLGMGQNQNTLIALLAAALWVFHPLHVSTVLYVVQRMTILSALFVVLSLLCYLVSRDHWHRNKNTSAILLMILCGVSSVLSVFSKENAVVFPVLLLALEFVLLPKADNSWKRLVYPGVFIGSFCVFGYLAYQLYVGLDSGWSHRQFNVIERLLTESRIIWQYLWDIVIPKSSTAGLFNDGIIISTSLIKPITTLPSVIAVFGLLTFSIMIRNRFKVLSLAILFYFSGHLIESSVISLELYFEHRNYLPSIFLAYACSYYLAKVSRYKLVISLVILTIILIQLWGRVSLWADRNMMLLVWAHNAPTSERAMLQESRIWWESGDYYKAKDGIEKVVSLYPLRPNAYLFRMILECTSSNKIPLDEDFINDAKAALVVSRRDPATMKYLELLLATKAYTNCTTFSWSTYKDVASSLLNHVSAKSGSYRASILRLMAKSSMQMEDSVGALEYYRAAYMSFSKTDTGLLFVSELASFGYLHEAKGLLSEIKADVLTPDRQNDKDKFLSEIVYLEHQINKGL